MVKKRPQKYSLKPANPAKSAMSMGTNLRVSFKNTCEVARTIRGMTLERANSFLRNVIKKKECVPFKKYNSGIGNTPQAKNWKRTQGRWPEKSARYLIDLLHNCETNAQFKGLDLERMLVRYVVVQRARRIRRRIYRAHGRINPFMSTPSHIEMILEEKPLEVKIPREEKEVSDAVKRRRTQRLNMLRKVKGLPPGASLKKSKQNDFIEKPSKAKKVQLDKVIKKMGAKKRRAQLAKAAKKGDAGKKRSAAKKAPTMATRAVALGKLVPRNKPEGVSDKVWEIFSKECDALREKLANPRANKETKKDAKATKKPAKKSVAKKDKSKKSPAKKGTTKKVVLSKKGKKGTKTSSA